MQNTTLCGILLFMPASATDLFVRPLFYETLSGRFAPSSDPQNRTHTLGRLAYAAFSQGDHTINTGGVSPYSIYGYRPSWAPHVLAKIECDIDRRNGLSAKLSGLLLTDTLGRSLRINDENHNGQQSIHIGNRASDERLPLALGRDLVRAIETVTEEARAFFELAHQL